MSGGIDDAALAALVRLGFTDLEARAYVFLLGESPATGYRVAQGTGRPAANVYKALESLERKGAILVEDGEVRHVRPVAVDELLAQLEAGFRRDRDEAEVALRSLDEPGVDEGVYTLSTADQVFARARTMIAATESDLVIDASPNVIDALESDLAAAMDRGIRVAAFAYGPSGLDDRATVVRHPDSKGVRSRWASWILLIVDGSRSLLGFLDESADHVQQAVYTGSPLISFSLLTGSISEMGIAEMRALLDDGADASVLRARFDALQARLDPAASPGFHRVQRLVGRTSVSPPDVSND